MKINPVTLLLTDPTPIFENRSIKIYQLPTVGITTDFLIVRDLEDPSTFDFEKNTQLVSLTVADLLKQLTPSSIQTILIDKIDSPTKSSIDSQGNKPLPPSIKFEQHKKTTTEAVEKTEPIRIRYKKREKNESLLDEGVKSIIIDKPYFDDINQYQNLFKVGDGLKNKNLLEYIGSRIGLLVTKEGEEPKEITLPDQYREDVELWDQLVEKYPEMNQTSYGFIAEDQDGQVCRMTCRMGYDDVIPG